MGSDFLHIDQAAVRVCLHLKDFLGNNLSACSLLAVLKVSGRPPTLVPQHLSSLALKIVHVEIAVIVHGSDRLHLHANAGDGKVRKWNRPRLMSEGIVFFELPKFILFTWQQETMQPDASEATAAWEKHFWYVPMWTKVKQEIQQAI